MMDFKKYKKLGLVIFAHFFAHAFPVQGIQDSEINGSVVVNHVHYDSLQVNGSLECEGLVVKEDLKMNGSLQADKLKCKTLRIHGNGDILGLEAEDFKSHGSLKAKNIQITGCLELTGKSEVWDGKLNKVELAAERTVFGNTYVAGAIRVKKLQTGWSFFGSKSLPQTLELKNKSIVQGDIVFEEEGEVHLFDGCEVRGQIRNAKVVRK
jgi:cytoskeletal protein CcmA (bactofilin family)